MSAKGTRTYSTWSISINGGRRSPSVDTLARILEAAGFELRMRLTEPDTHEAARRQAEAMLPSEQLDAFARTEQERVQRTRRPARGEPA